MELANTFSHYKKFKQTISTLHIGVLLLIIHGCGNSSIVIAEKDLAGGWDLEKQDEGKSPYAWTIYSRKKIDSPFREFRITGTINVSPKKAVQALRERTENSERYIPEEEGFIKILSASEGEVLVYSVFNMPLLFKNREMCERFIFTVDAKTGIHKITWREEWESGPPASDDLVRMPVARGSWEFVPLGEQKSLATYIVHAHPGGLIPAWMVNSTVGNGMPDEFKKIEEVANLLP